MTERKSFQFAGLLISHVLLLGLLLIGLFVVAWRATPVYAATVNVDDAGTDSPTCGAPDVPCRTIPYALANRAAAGDTVFVWEGTYPEVFALRAGIVISGAGTTRTFIDGEGVRGPMISASGSTIGPSTVLRGVTVRRGLATNGGGISIINGASPLIEDCIVSENVATGRGGGLYVNASASLTLRDTAVLNNTAASQGGGMYQSSTGGSRLDLFGARFENNETTGSNGGGLWINGTVVMTGTEFINNRAGYRGGGIYQALTAGRAEMIGGRLEDNIAAVFYGGGLGAEGTAILSGTQVVGNVSGEDGGGVWAGTAEVVAATLANNQTVQRGGGLFAITRVVMTGTSVINNNAHFGGGLAGDRDVKVTNSLFARNSAFAGSAVHMYGASAVQTSLQHVTIVSPTVTYSYPTAAAILVRGLATAMISNTIVGGYPYAIEAFSGGTVYEDYNLYYNLGTNVFNPNGGTVHSGAHSLFGLDPLFVDPAQDDYHLNTESPALDAGAFSDIVDDLDGDLRPANTAQPDAPDIGCDENKALTVRRLVTSTVTFGAACARLDLAESGSLSALNATVIYHYPTMQDTNKPLPRYYIITSEGEGPFSANLALCYTDEEFEQSDVSTEESLQLYLLVGSDWVAYPSTVDTEGNVVTAGPISTLGQWALGGAGGQPTAVQLASFSATSLAGRVLLQWETASEIGGLGFNIYRAGQASDEASRLNQALIPVKAPGSLLGSGYQFVDQSALPGRTYTYWLESIDLYGVPARHGPVTLLSRFATCLPLVGQ